MTAPILSNIKIVLKFINLLNLIDLDVELLISVIQVLGSVHENFAFLQH